MRRAGQLATAAVGAALSVTPIPAMPAVDTPIVSGNVSLLGTVPEVGAMGGRVMPDGRPYFVMTSPRGVTAYDVTIPEAPVLAGHLALPHFENEDVDFGDDLLIVSVDPRWVDLATPPGTLGGLYLIDISRLPLMTFAYVNTATGNRWIEPVADRAGHTTTCVRVPGLPACSFAYVNGVSEVVIADLRDPSNPRVAGTFDPALGGTHDGQVDDAGIYWVVGQGGFAAFDTSAPEAPVRIARHNPVGLNFHHNSWRPRASEWQPRTAEYEDDPGLLPGEVLLITEEDYLEPGCNNQGRFGTASIRNFDRAAGFDRPEIGLIDTWATELSTLGLPTPPIPVPFVGRVGGAYNAPVTCSAHYFSERDGIVAIAWYEQGTRFLRVSPDGSIDQVGYYVNPTGMTWDAEWIGESALGGEIVYTLDAARGIDILRFSRAPSAETVVAPILPSWLGGAVGPPPAVPHPAWGFGCRIPVIA